MASLVTWDTDLLLIHNDIIVDHWRGNEIYIGELRTGASVPVPLRPSRIVTPEDVRDVVLSKMS